ncbi:MAG: hypothetical protein WC824_05830 [Bacteroidota bacterium]|jgi:photosystem II stability/assembly factor-like uncharacterized protein
MLLIGPAAVGQNVEQVWPPDSAGALGDVVIYDESTLIAFGANDAIIQSDDGGATWNAVRWGNGEWNFYRAIRTGARVWVLALAAIEKHELYPEGADIRLMEYDPRTHALTTRSLPATTHLIIDAYTEAVDDTLFLLTQDASGAATLAWTTDGAGSWDTIPLPTVGNGYIDASFFCRDRNHLGLIMRNSDANGFSLYLTQDGGGTWRQCENLSVDYYRHYHASYLAGSGACWTHDNTIILTTRKTPLYPEQSFFAVSRDNGNTWERRAQRPHDPIILLAKDSSTVCYSDFLRNVYLSEDGCRTFRLVSKGSAMKTGQYGDYLSGHFDDWCTGLAMDGKGRIAACDRRGNLGFSTDNGETWNRARSNVLELHELNMFDELQGMLQARDIRTDRRNLYSTRDGGKSWTQVMDIDSSGFAGFRHQTPTLSFAVTSQTLQDGTAVQRSTDGGGTWITVAWDETPSRTYAFINTETDSSFIAVRTDSRILLSEDAGETWKRLSLPSSGSLYWLSRSGLGWFWIDDGLYLSDLSLRYGYWNTPVRILEWDGSPLAVQVFDELEACVVGCRKAFHTSTGGELWTDTDCYDCWAYRAWSVRDGRGAKYYPIEGVQRRYYWNFEPVYTTMDHWMTSKLTTIWYSAYHYMSGHYRWCSPPSSSSQYILTDHNILRVNFDGVSETASLLRPNSAILIEAPSPHPVDAGTSVEIRIRRPRESLTPMLDVFAINGKRVATIAPSDETASQATYRWDTSGVTPGSYVLRASQQRLTSSRIVVVR